MTNLQSLWRKEVLMPQFEPLCSDIRTDVLIVGGGMAGILCAYVLQNSGVDCAVVEAKEIFSGVSGNTTAKITVHHGLIYSKLIKRFGIERAQMYLEANQLALETYRNICAGIDCDFESKDNYVYSLHDRAKLEGEISALHRLGVPSKITESLPLPVDTVGAVCVPDQAQFDPLKFAAALVKDLPVYENTPVLELASNRARTPCGNVYAKNIVIATHFPILNKHGGYFLKMYQHRSYVLALENAEDVHGMYVDEADKGMSFRNHRGLLLLGGGDHRTGKTGGGWQELHEFASLHYPQSHCVCQWAAQDCMTLDGAPYIGQYSEKTNRLYVLTGFNKWGMTGAMAGAMLIKGMILDRKPDWAEVFYPSRSVIHPQLIINAAASAIGLITPTVPRCPHMGCALKYNPQEHTWDCPCHGSRFTKEGTLIDNPATGSLKKD